MGGAALSAENGEGSVDRLRFVKDEFVSLEVDGSTGIDSLLGSGTSAWILWSVGMESGSFNNGDLDGLASSSNGLNSSSAGVSGFFSLAMARCDRGISASSPKSSVRGVFCGSAVVGVSLSGVGITASPNGSSSDSGVLLSPSMEIPLTC